MRCVIAQANVLDPMACKGQAQDERGGHADWHARRARKDGAISAAGPSVEVLVHAARLRPGKVLVSQVAVEFQRHLGHVQSALRDDKAEWIAQWEGSQHHIARRVREEGQSVMQVNAAERVWQCARRGINRSTACERVRGSNGGELQKTGKRRTFPGSDAAEKMVALFLCMRIAASTSGGIWSCGSCSFRPPRSICSAQEAAAAASASSLSDFCFAFSFSSWAMREGEGSTSTWGSESLGANGWPPQPGGGEAGVWELMDGHLNEVVAKQEFGS